MTTETPVTLAGSDVQISRLIFGCWAMGGWYWGGADDRESMRAVRAALDLGITTFDTAPIYGFGRSEEVLGRALAGLPRESFQVATKCGLSWTQDQGTFFFEAADGPGGKPARVFRNLRSKSIVQECERSLKLLRLDFIDLYQIHWTDESVSLEEPARAFETLFKDGKIRAGGVSNFSVEEILAWRRLCTIPIASDQERYSLLERRIETGNLQYLRKHRIPLLAYEPLAQGLLTGKVGRDRKFADGDYRGRKSQFEIERRTRILESLATWEELRAQKETTFAGLALAWVLGASPGACAIVGARNDIQATENAGALHVHLNDEERTQLGAAFKAL